MIFLTKMLILLEGPIVCYVLASSVVLVTILYNSF